MRDEGADMLVPPPTSPVGDGPAKMPVNMAPVPPGSAEAGHTVGAKRRLLAALARRRAKRTRRI